MEDRDRQTHRYPNRARKAGAAREAEGNRSPPDDGSDCGGAGKKRKKGKIGKEKSKALKGVERDPSFLDQVSLSLWDDREVALAAIEGAEYCGNSKHLKNLSDNLKADRELNLIVAQKCGDILSPLFGDREIVMAAIARQPDRAVPVVEMWTKISEDLQDDIEVVLAAVASESFLYPDLPEKFKANRSVALRTMGNTTCTWLLTEPPEQFRGDKEIVMAAIQNYDGNFFGDDHGENELDPPHWFLSIPEELQKDHDVMFHAVARNRLFLKDVYLGASREADIEIAKAALESNLLASHHLPKALNLNNSPELAAVVVEDQHDLFHGEEDSMLSSVRSFVGTTLLEILEAIHNEFKLENSNCSKIDFRELNNVDTWSRKWKDPLWRKVWLVTKATESACIPSDIRKR